MNPDTQSAAQLSKLEYFAAAAMKGILAADTELNLSEQHIARAAVRCARALMEELSREAQQPSS